VQVDSGAVDGHKAVLINDQAVSTDQSRKFVYVVDKDNKAEYRQVTLGAATGGLRIVRSGLKAGEKIVVNGLQRVHPGALLAPQVVAMEPADVKLASAGKGN
jgi:multidrug efflux system membrane fusion protein